MRAEVVSIGPSSSLARSSIPTAAFIAGHLAAIGLDLFHKVTVGGELGRGAAALATALDRADVVITTGGLGPTADEVTREAAAQATGLALALVPELLQEIEAAGRRLRVGGGSVAERAEALRTWGRSDPASATVIDPPEGDVYPTRSAWPRRAARLATPTDSGGTSARSAYGRR